MAQFWLATFEESFASLELFDDLLGFSELAWNNLVVNSRFEIDQVWRWKGNLLLLFNVVLKSLFVFTIWIVNLILEFIYWIGIDGRWRWTRSVHVETI